MSMSTCVGATSLSACCFRVRRVRPGLRVGDIPKYSNVKFGPKNLVDRQNHGQSTSTCLLGAAGLMKPCLYVGDEYVKDGTLK